MKRGRSGRANRRVLVTRQVFCVMAGISDRQLAVWENEELVAPVTIAGPHHRPERLYDREALRRARLIRTLCEELEVNLPGVGVILHLLEQLEH